MKIIKLFIIIDTLTLNFKYKYLKSFIFIYLIDKLNYIPVYHRGNHQRALVISHNVAGCARQCDGYL